MAATATDGQVTLRGRFSEGSKVRLIPRTTDHWIPGATERPEQATATTKDGETVFKNVPTGPYWVVGEVDGAEVSVMVTAKPAGYETEHPDLRKRAHLAEIDRVRNVDAKTRLVKEAAKKDPLANSPAPGRTMPSRNPLHGARTTVDTRHAEVVAREEALAAEVTRPAHDLSIQQLEVQNQGQVVTDPPNDVEEPDTGAGAYEDRSVTQLREVAKKRGVTGASKLNKADLIKELRDA
jgi:hypothetical protein